MLKYLYVRCTKLSEIANWARDGASQLIAINIQMNEIYQITDGSR